MESITYSELKAKRDSGQLVAGTQYRITDYECTTTQEGSRAVANSFDIIVVADNENTLNENARACLQEGDTYYSASNHSANLEAWELKYSVDNDTTRFGWADAINGKGVIYWLKDERNNECPYDFKQIQFSREESGTSNWYYTFSVRDGEAETVTSEDASVSPQDADSENACSNYSNVIRPFYGDGYDYGDKGVMYLNMNIFDNYYGSACHSNTFGNDGYSNTFGDSCSRNTFGDGCNSNTFRSNCNSNTFGDSCYSNTFGNDGYSNTFGNDCHGNTFGNICHGNTFGNICYSNTFGDYCHSNTFGDSCNSNTFGDSCSYIDFFLTNGRGVGYNLLSGVLGSNSTHYVVSGTQGNQFATYVGKNSSGVIKTWVPADAVA